jgi:Ca2+-binding EF-hand superfamily protein
MNKNDQSLSVELFTDFFKYYGFGIENDEDFYDFVCNTFNLGRINSDGSSRKETRVKPETPKVIDNVYIDKLRKNLKSFGRKSIFSLVKHFKYFDNGTKFINKYDFIKVLRDFRLNLTVSDIEKIFDSCCTDHKQMLLNYEMFTLTLCPALSQERKHIVSKAYESLKMSTSSNKNVDIEVLKSFYNPKNHPLGKDEEETYAEFVECLDIFLYSYKMKKVTNISYEEFEEFYRIVGFLIDDDYMFRDIIISEWRKTLSNDSERKRTNESESYFKEKELFKPELIEKPRTPLQKEMFDKALTPNRSDHKKPGDRQFSAQQNSYKRTTGSRSDPLTNLKDILRRRGLRGLMNLHKQFLLSCNNLGTINSGDLFKVVKLQKIDLPKEEIEYIFDSFRQGNYLHFPNFIRNFKKILNENRLNYIETVFSKLDTHKTEMLNIEEVKFKFNASSHPDAVHGKKSEDDIITEFLDCFDLNYNFLVK